MTKTLFEWAGGAPAIERLTEVFYKHVHQDPVLAPVFAHAGDDHAHHVAIWLGEVFGGPATYTADHGGYPAMLGHHLGLSITPEQRTRWATLIAAAADEAGLPSDPEFRSAFVAYVEWGSRIGMENSQPGAEPPAAAPVPRWGWGEAPPYPG
ncbi:group II truncated hemoglobin [Amycolatopsis sp.]|jgi:hemoglobin|uniref:group II truncated hemoglobin n=1 Tax=Amycolatopsis sp. TaxID=37632 RepID=UPI002DF76F66|nr:group II truncated hemoglobin [Amycolatopsis sp.]